MANAAPIYAVGDQVEAMLDNERRRARVAQIKKAKGRREYKLEFRIEGTKRVRCVAVGNERGNIFPIVVEPAPVPPPTFVVVLPENLKRLVDEADEKINNGFLVTLPMNVPIAYIVRECLLSFNNAQFITKQYEKVRVVSATISHFEEVLKDNLVFGFERQQRQQFYETKMVERRLPTDTIPEVAFTHGFRYTDYYGIVHYIRLMRRMPEVALFVDPTGRLTEDFKEAVIAICDFLSENLDRYTQPNMYFAANRDEMPRAN